MDVASKGNLIHVSNGSRALSPITSSGASLFDPHLHPPSTSFPIIAIVVIGIAATAFMLVSYYIFVIKCCLHWHRIDLVGRFSLSRQREEPSAIYSQGPEPRGLEEAVIRLIPVIQYKTDGSREFGERSCCECAVCLNEFQEDEKLRIIPNCSHVFHIDCIDVWLQNNANCPLCRTSISFANRFHVDLQLLTPRPSPQDQSPHAENLISGDEDFVVIDFGNDLDGDQGLQGRQERANALELPTCPISRSAMKLEQRILQKKARKLQKVTSMGDECIDVRANDDHFSVQPIRRSFSMGSSGDRQFYVSVQEALQQQNGHVNEINSIEVCGGGGGSGRAKRSLFSFRNGSISRSAVLPVYLDP